MVKVVHYLLIFWISTVLEMVHQQIIAIVVLNLFSRGAKFFSEEPQILLLVRYICNVVNKSIWYQCKYIPMTDRPIILKISNGHISAMDHPIHSMFGSRVGCLGSADRMALFPVGPNSIGT